MLNNFLHCVEKMLMRSELKIRVPISEKRNYGYNRKKSNKYEHLEYIFL